MKAGFKWIALIIGATIGAGYASGRELWEFFGHESGLAIVLFTIFFTVSCFIIMDISYQRQTTDYKVVLQEIVGKKLTRFYDVMILIYLYTVTVVMLSGSGATGQAFKFPYWFGIGMTVIALFFLFIRGINELLTLNQYVLPVLILGLLAVLMMFTSDQGFSLFTKWHEQRNWMAAFPFTALNVLPLIAILGAVGHQVKSRKEIWVGSIGSGLILGLLTYIYNNSLVQISEEILLYDIPLFAILKEYPISLFAFMSVILWLAIFTTAASGVLGMVTRIQSYFDWPLWLLVLVLLLSMIPMTVFGFSSLIGVLYPLYGLLNLYVLTRLLLFPLWYVSPR